MIREIIVFIIFLIRNIFLANSATYLITQNNRKEGPHINHIINEFENSILHDHDVKREINHFYWLSGSSKFLAILTLFCRWGLIKKYHYFAVLMGPDFNKVKPYYIIASQLDVYIFDAWPPDYFPYIEEQIKKLNISHTFFSSRQVTEMFNESNTPSCYWIPEAVNYKKYHFLDYNKKDIDILQFGRRYNLVHEKLLNNLDKNLFKYIYSGGNLLLNSDLEFKEGLARSKISLCFPATVTHPERAGGINTMTTRYLQSMASRCLVVGKMPEEMEVLFDYQPVIDLNLDDPYKHLKNILENYDEYIPLIEKNYLTICQKHTWINRWGNVKVLL